MSKFKLGLSIIFSAFILIGVIVFATSKGSSSNTQANLTVWGFISKSAFDIYIKTAPIVQDKTLTFVYVQETPQTFQNDFVNAIANSQAPDIVILPQDMLTENENKLFLIPYTNYPERTFKDEFVQEGELFLGPTGMYALPFFVDPLVMYWNRDIFNTNSLSVPPKYWDEFLTLPTHLSKTDASGNFTQSAVALGEWNNINDAKAIFSDIMLTAGSPIIDSSGPNPRSALLDQANNQAISSAEASLNFFTQFANPTSQTYSWNRSLTSSLSRFLSGNLAVYFGFASELPTIRAKNPNLNFDVAFMPQARQAKKSIVFGNIYGLAIVKQSHDVSSSFRAITALTTDDSIKLLTQYTNLPPVKRTLLAVPPVDPYQSVFYQSSLVSQGWLDPGTAATDQIFQNMVESITAGKLRNSEALSRANDELNTLLQN
jgi:ABC-type glycerol-3-phosphate transport system substrate-binding protein